MGEVALARAVLADHQVLIAGDGGFDVKQVAQFRLTARFRRRIGDVPEGAMAAAFTVLQAEVVELDVDLDPQVDAGVADQGRQTSELHGRIGLAVTGNDKLAMAAEQFVYRQILDMPAVGDVHPVVFFIQFTAHFLDDG